MIKFKVISDKKLICPHINGTCPTIHSMSICKIMGRKCPRDGT